MTPSWQAITDRRYRRVTSSIGRYQVPGTAAAMHEAAIRRTSPNAGIQCRKLTSPCSVPRPRSSPFACKPLIHPTLGSRYPKLTRKSSQPGPPARTLVPGVRRRNSRARRDARIGGKARTLTSPKLLIAFSATSSISAPWGRSPRTPSNVAVEAQVTGRGASPTDPVRRS